MDEKIAIVKEKVDEYVNKNLGEVSNWTTLGEDQIARIKKFAVDIILERERILMADRFCKAVVDNNLKAAISWGDGLTLRSLKLFILVKENIYIE